MNGRDYFTTAEFARLNGLSRSTVARLVDKGRIPARRVGSHRRIFKIDLEAAGLSHTAAASARGGRPPSKDEIARLAPQLRRLALQYGVRHLRLFGSVARGSADAMSDVDLLVDLDPDRSLIDLAQLELAFEELVGRRVDVRTPASLRHDVRSRAMAEAVPI